MNRNILNTGVQKFIDENLHADIVSVLLSKPHFPDVSNKELVGQIESRKKAKDKLPSWFQTAGIYYPNKKNLEQSSSELTARYKASLAEGKSLIDITGGLGVDTYFFSKTIDKIGYCEKNPELAEIAIHNFSRLEATNIDAKAVDGLEFLRNEQPVADWIYVDPSRRTADNKKVFRLQDAEPAIDENLELLFSITPKLMIKTSPLLDIQEGLRMLPNTYEIHIVAVDNEVKELLWLLMKNYEGSTHLNCIDLGKKTSLNFRFRPEEERQALSHFSKPGKYLYEPNATILKSGAFKLVGDRYGLGKLNLHTHLYTSEECIEFPGRVFEILGSFPYGKQAEWESSSAKANISCRNFPMSVREIRKRHKIADGGELTLFFTTDMDGKRIVIRCRRLQKDRSVPDA